MSHCSTISWISALKLASPKFSVLTPSLQKCDHITLQHLSAERAPVLAPTRFWVLSKQPTAL